MSLFQNTVVKKHIEAENVKISAAYGLYSGYFLNPEIQENIRNSKEEQFQEGFLRELFVKVLGYTLNPEPNFNLITEKKNEADAKKADGAILVGGEVVGVIELKDCKTTDLKQVESQAFGYKNNNRKASYVITSNFEKLRFYIDNAIDFIEFNLFTLSADDFAMLWLCLAYENISRRLPKQLKAESVSKEDQITKQLYKDYSEFKRDLFADLTANNPQFDQLTLFKKSQKLLDRLLFIFFAEDSFLLPPNSVKSIIEQWERLRELDEYRPLYDRLKKYFGYMNTGHHGKEHDIFAYNGGLFKADEVLDAVTISDEVLRKHSLRLSDYNFASEVDVNILGHIFENSLTEIEEVTNAIEGKAQDAKASKRKKDGVFYTPRYITTYIVENTLGKLCAEKKAELKIDESEYYADKRRQLATRKRLDDQLQAYRAWLLELTICDPACGSGAFLNAALDFLMAEHKLIDEMTAKLLGHSIAFPDIENAILENNLYGVDINEESVEIAKLALWLRTAKPHRKLNSLNDNIKCGNSLISDPILTVDAGQLELLWKQYSAQWFLPRYLGQSKIKKQLRPFAKSGALQTNAIGNLLHEIIRFQEEERLVSGHKTTLGELYGKSGRKEDWDNIEKITDDFAALNALVLNLSGDISVVAKIKESLAAHLTDGIEPFKGLYGHKLASLDESFDQLVACDSRLQTLLGVSDAALYGQNWLDDATARLSRWQSNLDKLKDWYQWLLVSRRLDALGIGFVAEAYSQKNIPTHDIQNVYRKSLYHACILYIVAREPKLELFKGKLFEDVIRKYKELAATFQDLTKKEWFKIS